ncbi:sensor histidine kinase [Rhodoplanes serenus]|jgi:signal transduction histidine kinase|uniref:histidine kinase n=1 Tax=Rhodoplanes serenus TaxID=200615 RepID=A0A327K0K1_9BRAD|nr:sensor histidine kinase [Rhodoplanes serenus]MTW15184.1 sensor histidine kinase [Rhodoplanes serenus]RAI31957.1 ATP-binding protein [Rhodoplanes serenus]
MRANSLALRLFLSATAWTVVILLATGISLSSLYRQAVERSFDRRLGVYLRTLVAEVAAPEEGNERGPLWLGEPLFELPLSGWYWQISRLGAPKPETRSSRSLWDSTLPHLADQAIVPGADGSRRAYVGGPEEQRLRLVERTVDLGEEGRFLVSVAGDPQEIDEETRSFDKALGITFVMLAAVLLLITMFQVRFGLAPLKRISESLAAIRAGRSERLEGDFPHEIAPLARETNALLEANREIVERARTHVGNLAHALKTPLSVMVNEAAGRDDPFARKVREQAAIMRDQVTRHLERARLSARLTVVGTVTEVRPVVTALARTMEKLHHDRGLVIDAEVPDTLRFVGERQDLEEMVGNLVDNACKWAEGRVSIEVRPAPPPGPRARAGLLIVVDDDGPGLSEDEREQVARRGRRLDESKPGSGLGLSIVTELAGLYGGKLTLSNAPIGGLRAELVLPAG